MLLFCRLAAFAVAQYAVGERDERVHGHHHVQKPMQAELPEGSMVASSLEEDDGLDSGVARARAQARSPVNGPAVMEIGVSANATSGEGNLHGGVKQRRSYGSSFTEQGPPTAAARDWFLPPEWMPMVLSKSGWKMASGAFGALYIAQVSCNENEKVENMMWMAFKVGEKTAKGETNHELWKAESRIGLQLDHPYIVKFFEESTMPDGRGVIAMEWASEQDWVKAHRWPYNLVDQTQLAKNFLEILYGLKYLHDKKMAHTDLKPANLVIACPTSPKPPPHFSCTAKIADLGMVVEGFTVKNPLLHERRGTPDYMAPEVAAYSGISPAADMWSMGVVLWELTHKGNLPYGHIDTSGGPEGVYEALEREVSQPPGASWYPKPEASDSPRKHLMYGLLKFHPRDRLTADQAIPLAAAWAKAKGVPPDTIDEIKQKAQEATDANCKARPFNPGRKACGATFPYCWDMCAKHKCASLQQCKVGYMFSLKCFD